MPRKGLVSRRVQATDPVYGEAIVEKFICSMMWEGKKSTAQRVFYGAMDQVAKKTNDDALKIFKKAIENLKPILEVKTRRVGGANYQVPVEVNPFRRQSLAIRWLLQYSRERAGRDHGRQARRRADRRGQFARRRHQEEGRCAPHGRSQQGFRPLPLVKVFDWISFKWQVLSGSAQRFYLELRT